jgi:hypothetical protein
MTLVKAKVTKKSKLKPHNSFDAGFWESGPDLAGEWEEKSKIEVEQLQLKPFKGTPWEKSLEAAELIAKMKAHALEKRLCQDQAKRLKLQPGDTLHSMRRSFMALFTTSKMGLAVTKTGARKRSKTVQANFRKRMIKSYKAANPDPNKKTIWCPISRRY